jgi:FixJ family two-component response regulator
MIGGPLVCVIDDDASVLKSLSRLLTAWGYEVRAFAAAQQFLQQSRDEDERIGCLVLDVHMPGMSGIDLRAELDLANRRLPIVFVTGIGDERLRRRALSGGAIRVLEKPFDEAQLRCAVQEAVANAVRVRSASPTAFPMDVC